MSIKLLPAMLAALPLFTPSPCAAALPDLGEALNYAVFGITVSGSEPVQGTSSATINGNVGVGPDGSLNFTSSAKINGNLDVNAGATYTFTSGAKVTGTITTGKDFSQAEADLKSAATAFAALSPTQTFGNITGTKEIDSTGTLNVIDVNKITLSSTQVLTLKGGANDYFIINLLNTSGTVLSFTSSSKMNLTGGLTADHVLFNVEENKPTTYGVQLTSSGKFYGTILAPSTGVELTSSATLNGAIYGDGKGGAAGTLLTSSAVINQVSFSAPLVPSVPEPSTFVIACLGSFGLIGHALRNRRKV